MTKYDDLTRCLLAAGGAPSEDGKTMNLVYEEDNDLVVKEWTGSEVGDQALITSGVKKSTDAPYLEFGDKRLVFFIDESNTLQCFTHNDTDGWDDFGLGEAKIDVHPLSRLTACPTPTGVIAFFQALNGSLKGIKMGEKSLEVFDKIPATPMKGAALSVVVDVEDKVCLFYMHEDNNMHYVVQNSGTGAWKDHILEKSAFDTPITRVLVSQDPQTKTFVAAFLTASTLFRVESSGKRTELGDVVGEKFKATGSEESILVGYIPVYVGGRGRYHGKMISKNSHYWSSVEYRR
ncbi:hypothetical protein BGZ60DRAFT_535346 [Tricladium varicosporioides]|nr:hypothetical protein BGZ60DRAFT_535346 [Hymenoscyphus varicosporioides]